LRGHHEACSRKLAATLTAIAAAVGVAAGVAAGLSLTPSANAAAEPAQSAATAKAPRYVVLNCADGHFHPYPALAVFWGRATVKGYPADRRHPKLTLIFTGKARPPVYVLQDGKPVLTRPQTQTFDLWS
jgi:hypothetical protein